MVSLGSSEFLFRHRHKLHQRTLQTGLESLVALHGNHKAFDPAFTRENVVAAVDPRQPPALLLRQFGKMLARNRLHTATSRIRSEELPVSCSAASNHPWMASCRFFSSSASVSP